MKRLLLIFTLLVSVIGILPVYADSQSNDTLSADSYLESVYDAIPEEVRPFLQYEYSSSSLTADTLVSISEVFIGRGLQAFLAFVFELGLYLLLIALMKRISDAFLKGSFIPSLITGLVLVGAVCHPILELAQMTEDFGHTVRTFVGSASVTLGGVLALGGNTISSVRMAASVGTVSYVLQTVCLSLLFPTVMIVLVTVIGASVSSQAIQAIGRVARSFYQWVIGFISFFSVTVLTYQSVLAASEDTLAAKTVRFAISGSVPIVGGALGESLGTLTASVQAIRSGVGILGVMTVLVLALFPLSALLAFRFAVLIGEELSNALGLSEAAELLGESRKLANMLIGVTVLIGILFIFVLSLYIMLPLAYS